MYTIFDNLDETMQTIRNNGKGYGYERFPINKYIVVDNTKRVTLQGLEYSEEFFRACADNRLYIVKFRTVYECRYTAQGNVSLAKVYTAQDALVKRGHHIVCNAASVNYMLGHKIFVE